VTGSARRDTFVTEMTGGSKPPAGVRQLPRPVLVAVAVAGASLATAAGVFVATRPSFPGQGLSAAAHIAVVLVPVLVGVLALGRNPSDRFARILVGIGLLWSATALAESPDPVLYSVGRIAGWIAELTVLYLLLAFPSGRLTTALERRMVTAAVVLLAALYLPTALLADAYPHPSPYAGCGLHCPSNGLQLTGSQAGLVDDLIRPLRETLTFLLYAALTAILVRRVRAAGPLLRRALVPVVVIAVYRAAAFAVYTIVRVADPSAGALRWIGDVYVLSLPLVAVSFGVGLLLRQLYASVALQRLALQLRASAGPVELRVALGKALEDPSLRVLYWRDGDAGGWVDESGWPVALPTSSAEMHVTEVRSEDRRIAALVQDGPPQQDLLVLQAAAAYALVVLENGRLIETLSGSLGQLTRSRARVVAIADETRRGIERDLHDGAQQRLIALRIKLSIEAERLESLDPARAQAIAALGDEAETAIDELRALAHGIYPALLTERGLPDALRAVARAATLSTSVDTDGVGRYPADVESTVYFACVEALQNAEKHATGATHVAISLSADGKLAFEVRDDGAGFDPDATPEDGTLQALRDRVHTIGGQLAISSQPGRGTSVAGSVPIHMEGA
jgi:signal transduction histidine kinase